MEIVCQRMTWQSQAHWCCRSLNPPVPQAEQNKDLHSRELCIDWSPLITLLGTRDRCCRQAFWDIQMPIDLRWKLSGTKLKWWPWIMIIYPVMLSTCFLSTGMTDAWRTMFLQVSPAFQRPVSSRTRLPRRRPLLLRHLRGHEYI